MSSSGQNAEEANELMATMKAEHVPMKTWYNNPAHTSNLSSLKTKYGDTFPTFWQDLIKWEGWKDVRREYLLFTENGNKFNETKSGGGGSRKRRKRWGVSSADNDDGNPNPRGRSRFANAPPTAPAPAPQADPVMAALGLSAPIPSTTNSANTGGGGPLPGMAGLASNVPEKNREELASLQARLRKANSRLQNIDVEAARVDALPRDHPDRSPSPPPIYDQYGTRKNTRANRWREKYTEERTVCLESIMELIPSMRPPGFISKRKRSRKIHIPVEEYPTYNFIGLIIGPRGKTQKDMENKTGCKIAIRGKGSVKEGAKGRRNGQPMEGDDEPLHVLITGDDPTNIDAAAQMITDMLVVIDDEKNVHKQNQLRELALLNGTLKDEDWCNVCGEKGHKDFECPKRFTLGGRSKIQVKCAICGDTSHPTRDCAQQSKVVVSGEEGAKAKLELDEDYSAFMAELDGKPVGGTKGPGEGGQGGGGAVDENDPVAKAAAMPPSLDGQSFCTVLQPARVVDKNGGDGENTTFESDAVAKAAAAAAAQPSTAGAGNPWVSTISAVTTISAAKTVGQGSENNALPDADNSAAKEEVPGVTTISSTAPTAEVPGVTTISSSQVPTGVTTFSGVTTISSTAPVAAESTAEAPSTNNAAPVPPQANVTSLPPPPPSGLPPVPAGLPPPPPGPPPTQPFPGQPNPYQYQQPPPPPMGYPGQQQPPPPMYGQPPPPTYPPQQQQWGAPPPQQQQGWNPNSYYNYGGGDATGGAGGFNWWDQSSE